MKELEFIQIIKNTLSKKSHIGDDCAYLKDLDIVVTQDTLIENIHFLTKFSSPYQLGYKSLMVNLSDICAAGAIPKYFTISLSLPLDTSNDFVTEFYKACEDLSNEFDFEVIGGDITGAEKISISVCAIGLTKGRNIASRSYAKVGDCVVAVGNHGSSTAGLWLLQNFSRHPELDSGSIQLTNLTNSHLLPTIQSKFSEEISTNITDKYAMMDTSDGLVDAIFKIAQASDVQICVDFDKIPYDKTIESVAKLANVDFKDWVLYGGEDFQLVACVSKENLKKLKNYTIIGEVKPKSNNHFVEINFGDKVQQITDLEKTFNHFKGKL